MTPPPPYLICATPRSGSTLLCDLLAATGVAGVPEEYCQFVAGTDRARHPREYMGDAWEGDVAAILGDRSPIDEEPTQFARRGATSFAEYLAIVRALGTTPNGAFGFKIMWGYFDGLLQHLAEGTPVTDRRRRRVLEDAFPGLRYVHMTRRDKERQAMSLWRALQTWTWRSGQPPRPGAAPVFDRRAIEHLTASLEADDAAWRRWFAEEQITPVITVHYEEFAADTDAGVRAVLDALDLPVPDGHRARARMRPQTDATTAAWLAAWRAPGLAPPAPA